MTVDVSIIFPAYNEEDRLGPTLEAFDAFLAESPHSYELLVVDDGSSDGTVALTEEFARSMTALRCVVSPTNQGKGHAVRLGMLEAVGAIRIMSDADGSTPSDQLPLLLSPLLAGRAQVAIGSRYVEGARVERLQPLYRRLWSRFANRIIQWTLLPGIADTHCGFKGFGADAAESIFSQSEIDGWSFDLEVLALARAGGFVIEEVGVHWADDAQSRVRLVHVFQAVRELLRIRRRVG